MNDSTLKGSAAEAAAKGYIGGNVYLTQAEAAEYLRLSPRTLERHRVAGTGPRFTKLGRRVVYRLDSLDAWAERRTFASTAEADAATAESGAA